MDNTKSYEYILSDSEISEFCCVASIEKLKRKGRMWVRLAVILILELFILPSMAVFTVAVAAIVVLAVIIQSYKNVKKYISGQQWTICVENGKIMAERGGRSEIPCSSIKFIRTTRHLLMFGYLQTAEQPAWFIMPLWIFEDSQEREAFINTIRNPWADNSVSLEKSYMPNMTYTKTDNVNNADATDNTNDIYDSQWRAQFTYMLDEEKWVQHQTEWYGIINSGIIGDKERIRKMLLFGCFMALILIITIFTMKIKLLFTLLFSFLELFLFKTSFAVEALLMFIIYVVGLGLYTVLRVFFKNPERAYRRQAKTSQVKDKVYGVWNVSFSEEGISYKVPIGYNNFAPWETIEWLVETNTAYFFLLKENHRYIVIPKECILNQSQIFTIQQLVVHKGIKAIQAKKMNYIPDWVFLILLTVVISAYIGFNFHMLRFGI